VYDAELTGGRRPVFLVSRDWAIPLLSIVTVAMITSNIRGLHTEVPVGRVHGL
jgi:mRNA-degrading endonuclease toxin of MazEF toxin-antitoxin module